jgi:hypothetical protein
MSSALVRHDTLLNERQAAIILNLSSRTLQAWRAQGCGPKFVRAGRSIRYRPCDLLAWMEANSVSPKSPEEDGQ